MAKENTTVQRALQRLQSNGPIQTRKLNPPQVMIANSFTAIMSELDKLGADTSGMEDTPARYARFLTEFISKPEFNFTLFTDKTARDMVIVNQIPVASLCEHHTLPFFGTATVAYIPNGKIVGLSKLPRLVEYFARGFQTQERLTNQIGEFLVQSELNPSAVGISLRCVHTCMSIRGAKAHGAATTTQFVSGHFTLHECKNEFLKAIKHD